MIRAHAAIALAAALSFLLLGSAPAAAQVSNNQIAYGAIMKAPVGSWAEYKIAKEGAESVRVRYTLVARDGKRVAVEVDSQTPMGRVVMHMEFAPDAKDGARWNLAAAKMRMPDGQLREMPIPAQHDRKSASFGKGDSFGDKLGREDISVEAGKFSTDHYRRKAGEATTDVWMDDKVLPVGMVRLEDGSGSHVELVAVGKNGKSAF